MVPNGWSILPLSAITKEKISYGIVQAGPHVKDGVPYIKSSDVGSEIQIDKLQRTSTGIHHKYRRSAVHPSDIVFSLRGNIGRTSIVPPELNEANLTQGTARISVSSEHDTKYVYYQLASTPILNKINSLSKGSTFKEISLEELRKVKLTIPSLPEQSKIATILSTWDKAISTTERLIDNSKQQKKALMQQLLTGKKRLLDDTGRRFSGVWEKHPVGKICKSIVPGRNKPKQFDGDIPWVTTPEIKGRFIPSKLQLNYISKTTLKECGAKLVPEGAVVMAAVGELGLTSITTQPLVLNQQLHAFVCDENINNVYLSYWLSYQKPYMESVASKTTIPYMNKTNCESIPVLVPSIEEQKKIASVLTNADNEIDLLEQQLADLKQEKKALMQQLLTGKRRVKVENTEEA